MHIHCSLNLSSKLLSMNTTTPATTRNETLDYDNDTMTQENDIWLRAVAMFSKSSTVVAVILGIMALFGNITSLLALTQISRRLSSYIYIIISLALSDIVITVTMMLSIVHKIIHPAYYPGFGPENARLTSRCMFVCIKAVNTMALTSTLLNALAMALDHYVAILRPMHHQIILTKRRIALMITGLWMLSALIGFSDYFSGLYNYSDYSNKYNYCEYIYLTKYQEEYPVFGIAIICLLVMIYVYTKIYITVRRHQRSEFRQMHKNKKAMITTVLLLGSFVLCWLPICLFQITMSILTQTNFNYVETRAANLRKLDQHLEL